jgi:hypothetical protein
VPAGRRPGDRRIPILRRDDQNPVIGLDPVVEG